jgi:hypothetical protein
VGLKHAIRSAIVSRVPLWLKFGNKKRDISMINDISAGNLRRAATIKDKIEFLQAELNRILGVHAVGKGPVAHAVDKKSGRRKMSAAGRAKIAAAARARWAKAKAAGKKSL